MHEQMFAVIFFICSVNAEDLAKPTTHHNTLVNDLPIYLFKPEPIYKKIDFLTGHSQTHLQRPVIAQAKRAEQSTKPNGPIQDYFFWPTETDKNLKQIKRALFWSPADFPSTYKRIKENSEVYFGFPGDLSYKPHRDPALDSDHDKILLSHLPFGNKHVYPKYTYGPFVYRFLRFPSVLHKLIKYRNYKKKVEGAFQPIKQL